jgi:hypothetical protein
MPLASFNLLELLEKGLLAMVLTRHAFGELEAFDLINGSN